MGAYLTTRQHDGVEEVDVVSNHAYKYPPRSGNYFGSHFIMGGERFDTPQPESYLFGENSDLNFLGSRPTPFPYPPPQPNEPTKTLKSLVNIRKESLRFVRSTNDYSKCTAEKANPSTGDVEQGTNSFFNIEFIFDCDVKCKIKIYYFCTEELTPNGVVYTPQDPCLVSEAFHYNSGSNQLFCQPSHIFNPSKYSEGTLAYDVDREVIPIAIHCLAEEGLDDQVHETRQSHTTIATVEKVADGTYSLKALKQKLFVDGLCYLLQEIYGIENKNNEKAGGDDETEDNGSECVICMCEVRDTLILPCRHLCLCNSCADSLRYQANNCPICRAPFRALLQIRALQKCSETEAAPIGAQEACDNIPPGYEAVSLIEALNGPCFTRPAQPQPELVETPDDEQAIQAAQVLGCLSHKGADYGDSVLMIQRQAREDEGHKGSLKSPLLVSGKNGSVARNAKHRVKDNLKMVNEKCEKEKEETLDEDSEAEKLSPLLEKDKKYLRKDSNEGQMGSSAHRTNSLALNMADVIDHIDDDGDTDPEEQADFNGSVRSQSEQQQQKHNDDSDYYTPDEPNPSAPLYESEGENEPRSSCTACSSTDGTPRRMTPGTPLSHASTRSSADSYASGSSTRHLLTVVVNSPGGATSEASKSHGSGEKSSLSLHF